MKRYIPAVAFVLFCAAVAEAQTPELHFVADTLMIQADGTFESDPDLGTMTFDISAQDKDLKVAYGNAAQSAQRVFTLAQKYGVKKEDASLGVLTVVPSYDRDRKNRAKSYQVHGQIVLKVRDLSQIGPILDGAVEEGIVEFRSVTYSLQDEEAAKERAVAAAMHSAIGRATAALAQGGQKLGALRYANVDVKQIAGVLPLQARNYTQLLELAPGTSAEMRAPAAPPPVSLPTVTPEKITVSASVQCAFQIL